MENKTVTENSTVSCAEEMNTAEVYGSDQYAADLKTASKDRQTSGKQRSSSKFSTMSMVTGGNIRSCHMCDGFYPFPRIYPAWIYPCDDHTYPGYYRFAFDGTEKRRSFRIPFGLTSFINNTMNPTPTSFVFTPFYSIAGVSGGWGSVIICFLPRILVGIIPYYVYKLIIRFSNEKQKDRCVKHWTCDCRRGGRNDKYAACYESDFSVFSGKHMHRQIMWRYRAYTHLFFLLSG